MKIYEAIKELIENNKMIRKPKKENFGSNTYYKILKSDIGDLIVQKYGEDGQWNISSLYFEIKDLQADFEIVENEKE